MTSNKYTEEAKKFTTIKKLIKDIDLTIYAIKDLPKTYNITAVQGYSCRGIGNVNMSGDITFVNEMPIGGVVYNGYLLYDLDTELFAGVDGKWEKRVKNILIDGDDVNFPTGEAVPRFSIVTLHRLGTGNEVVLVPCKSHVAAIDGDLFIYQEFDWHRAFGLKSRSGKLSIM